MLKNSQVVCPNCKMPLQDTEDCIYCDYKEKKGDK